MLEDPAAAPMTAEESRQLPSTHRERPLPAERPVTIFLNEHEVVTLQATPTHLDELAVGFLFSEGLITGPGDIQRLDVGKRGIVKVVSPSSTDEDFGLRRRYVTSGCAEGMTFVSAGHAKDITPIPPAPPVPAARLVRMMTLLEQASEMHRTTGGVHACGFGTVDADELAVAREDIGRHNSLDKVFGRLMLDGIDPSGGVLLTTGRISYEMVVKAAKAKVPIVLSRTAVTDLAAEIASDLSLCLIAYVRGSRYRVVSAPERVRESEST
jgi:FdhD protein